MLKRIDLPHYGSFVFGRERPIVAMGKPYDILFLGLGVRLRRIFGEAVEGHETAMLRPQPDAPVRRCGVANVGNRGTARARWRRHTPAHHQHLQSALAIADHGSRVIGKHARHRLKVADIAIDHAEQRDDRGLVRGDAVQIAHHLSQESITPDAVSTSA